jgi:hypothetical protein
MPVGKNGECILVDQLKTYDYSFVTFDFDRIDLFRALGIHAPSIRVVSTIMLRHVKRRTQFDTM